MNAYVDSGETHDGQIHGEKYTENHSQTVAGRRTMEDRTAEAGCRSQLVGCEGTAVSCAVIMEQEQDQGSPDQERGKGMAAGIAEAILFHQMERCIGANSFDLVLQGLIAANGQQSAACERKAEPCSGFGNEQKQNADGGDTLPVSAVGQRNQNGREGMLGKRLQNRPAG